MKEEFSEGAENTEAGIFCDWMDTIFRPTEDEIFDIELVEYLNTQHEKGIRVTVISTVIDVAFRHVLGESGLHPDIIQHPKSKASLLGRTLEVLIDDSPSRNLKSKTCHHPDNPAFRAMLKQDQSKAQALTPDP